MISPLSSQTSATIECPDGREKGRQAMEMPAGGLVSLVARDGGRAKPRAGAPWPDFSRARRSSPWLGRGQGERVAAAVARVRQSSGELGPRP